MEKLKTATVLALICTVSIIAFLPVIVKAEETLLWGADVPSNGTPVTSPVLSAGLPYRIEATGNFWYDIDNHLLADAQYYTTIPSSISTWANYFPAPDGASFLQINGENKSWGPFSNGIHMYTIYYMGTGDSITFTIVDWVDGNLGNNLCHIHVEIWETERYEGFTPGFWKNHPEAWDGYMPSDLIGDVFNVHCDLADDTLMDALNYHGGSGLYGSARILLRAATAAILNGAHADVDYPLTDSEVIDLVNDALASHDRGTILDLADQLDIYNNYGGSMD